MEIDISPAERELLLRNPKTAMLLDSLRTTEHGQRLSCSHTDQWLIIEVCSVLLLDIGINRVGKLTEEGKVLDSLIDRVFPE